MRILVIGDSCTDFYIYGASERFCPDAPVPVLKPIRKIQSLGMAGNVKENLEALGVKVDLISNQEKINKTRYVHERTNHMFIRIDEGEDNVKRIKTQDILNINFKKYDAVIVSDYCKGFLLEEDLKFISKHHPLTFLDTKKHLNGFADDFTFIKINI